jgi:hypothetical protein
MLRSHIIGGAAALALMAPAAAQAAPGMVKLTAQPAAQTVAERGGARQRARRAKAPRVYGYTSGYTSHGPSSSPRSALPFSYGVGQPDEYAVGSNAWWRAMKTTGHIR